MMAILISALCLSVACYPKQEEKTNKMTTVSFDINEEFIDDTKNGSFEIIEPLWRSVDICSDEQKYESDLSKFTLEQRYVFAISSYIAEVNNGGHDQFYFNSTGIVTEDALKGFKAIGLNENYSILKKSIERLGGMPLKDRYKRQKQLEKSEANFDDLNTAFYNTNPEIELMKYIKANKDKFYFKGDVTIPE